jgi:hypothetical protein
MRFREAAGAPCNKTFCSVDFVLPCPHEGLAKGVNQFDDTNRKLESRHCIGRYASRTEFTRTTWPT